MNANNSFQLNCQKLAFFYVFLQFIIALLYLSLIFKENKCQTMSKIIIIVIIVNNICCLLSRQFNVTIHKKNKNIAYIYIKPHVSKTVAATSNLQCPCFPFVWRSHGKTVSFNYPFVYQPERVLSC